LKALLCREFAPLDALRVEDCPDPVAEDGHVVIDVAAASVNYPDALMVQGKYQLKPELPFIPGFECAGTISEVGADCGDLRVGMRVFGFAEYGCIAGKVAMPAASVIGIGKSLAFERAAVLPLTYGTVYHALKDRADLRPGESLLVLGAGGGIGTAAIELGKLMGATVIAAASSADPRQRFRGAWARPATEPETVRGIAVGCHAVDSSGGFCPGRRRESAYRAGCAAETGLCGAAAGNQPLD
jgi:NADPH2:quinone reductase